MRRLAAGLLLLFLAVGVAQAAGPPPREVVRQFYDTLLEAMKKAKTLGVAGRYALLKPAVERAYDLPGMTRLAVGSAWSRQSPEAQKALVQAFDHYTTANYAAQFDGYDGERFEVTGEKPAPGGGTIVTTHLVPKNGQPVELDYLMRQMAGEWRIQDVYLSGTISQLANHRSEFSSVMRDKGAAKLASVIQSKADDLLAKAN